MTVQLRQSESSGGKSDDNAQTRKSMDQQVESNCLELLDKLPNYPIECADQSNGSRKQFEIRWQQVNCLSSITKRPKIITNSLPYKLLFGRSGDSDNQDNSSLGTELGETTSSKSRYILYNISGSVCSGHLTAVLGPSGVGKTTLLNSLTGQIDNLDVTGKVSLIGGQPGKRLSVVIVPQADILPEQLTTLEDLQFTSRLKNPGDNFDHVLNIKRVVRQLKMENFLNTRIKKLSGGETRRLSIGRELLGNPNVLILDEPTSGLDASTCKKVISALRDIVESSETQPMSIIVTIHQPQREVLNLFHRCYVMAQGGRAIYQGPPSKLLPHLLTNSTLKQLCDPSNLNENPAVVAIEVASGEYGPDVINQFAIYHESQFHLVAATKIGNQQTNTMTLDNKQSKLASQRRLEVDKRLEQCHILKNNLKAHTWTLVKRCWLLAIRNRFLMTVRLITYVLVSLTLVLVFFNSIDPQENACPVYKSEVDNLVDYLSLTKGRLLNLHQVSRQSHNNLYLFYAIIFQISVVSVSLNGLTFPMKMQIFIREHRNGWYSPESFIFSQALAELPIELIGPVLVVIISYTGCNLPDSIFQWRLICSILVFYIANLISGSIAQIAGAIFMNSFPMSVFMSCITLSPIILFSGIVISVRHMMFYTNYLTYASYFKYTIESLLLLRYGYGMCPCNEVDIYGYPIQITAEAVPKQFELLSRRIIDSYQKPNANGTYAIETSLDVENGTQNSEPNIVLKMLRLMTDASNMFALEQNQLGDCKTYRSLVLIDWDIQDGNLLEWLAVMALILVITKFVAYLVVKLRIMIQK